MDIKKEKFRVYKKNDSIYKQYKMMRKNQTYDFAKMMKHDNIKRLKNNGTKMNIIDAILSLDNFVDSSDPDINLSNVNHLLQTAEQLRKDQQPEWLQLTGLMHDLGKIIGFIDNNKNNGTSIDTQWAIVGDTYPLGCKLKNKEVYPELDKECPDMSISKYNSDNGIYKNNCGLSNLIMTWGHDEYLYDVITYNRTINNVSNALPKDFEYIIIYHSFYPWHKYNEYKQFEDTCDRSKKYLVQLFNKYDLYTKTNTKMDVNKLMPYYERLILKYFPNGYLIF